MQGDDDGRTVSGDRAQAGSDAVVAACPVAGMGVGPGVPVRRRGSGGRGGECRARRRAVARRARCRPAWRGRCAPGWLGASADRVRPAGGGGAGGRCRHAGAGGCRRCRSGEALGAVPPVRTGGRHARAIRRCLCRCLPRIFRRAGRSRGAAHRVLVRGGCGRRAGEPARCTGIAPRKKPHRAGRSGGSGAQAGVCHHPWRRDDACASPGCGRRG